MEKKYSPVLLIDTFLFEYCPGPGALDFACYENLDELDGFMNLAQEDLYFDIGYLPVFEIPGNIVYCPGPGTIKDVE